MRVFGLAATLALCSYSGAFCGEEVKTQPAKSSDVVKTFSAPVVVRARLSKEYLANYVERNVDRTKEVHDLILGTRIGGESRTVGKTRLVLYENGNHALGEVIFEGTVHAKTLGRNGPARLNYLSDSNFKARKRILVDEHGLRTAPATADAATELTLTGIRTTLPGLRGRIAQRIATRRAGQSRAAANAVASDHTADDVRNDLNRKLDETIAAIQKRLKLRIESLQPEDAEEDLLVRSWSTPDRIEVAICQPNAEARALDELLAKPLVVEGNPHLTVRIHRSAFARGLGDAETQTAVLPLLTSLLTSNGTQPEAAEQSGTARTFGLPKCTLDGEWIALELPAGEATAVRVATDDAPATSKLK